MHHNRVTRLLRAPIVVNACLTLVLAGCGGSSNSGSTGTGSNVQTYSLSGTVSGLNTGSLVLAVNGTQVTVAGGATTVSLASGLSSGTAYTVTVVTAPTGETCSVANGTGTISSANAGNVVVTCSEQAYALGGTISGLTQSGLVLANGSTYVSVSAGATSFALSTVAYSSGYSVSVLTQPQGLACSVSNGNGTMPAAAVTNVAISCTDQPFSLGGAIVGLGNGTGLILTNGADSLTVGAGATSFVMPTKVDFGSAYAVQIQSSPAGLTCSVANGSGTMGAANVTQVAITCSGQAYTLGGSVTGLTQGGLVLSDGSNTVTLTAGSDGFAFPPLAIGASYSVQVQTNPTEETCSVSNGTGTMPAGSVSSVAVTCAMNTYTVGGVIYGLSRSGLVLSDNGGDLTSIAINATQFTMNTGVADGAGYNVNVATQPYGVSLHCEPSGNSGTSTTDVTSIAIDCYTITPAGYTITASYLNPVGVTTDAAGDLFFVNSATGQLMEIPYSQGVYGSATQIATGLMYAYSVAVDPAGNVFVSNTGFDYVYEVPYSQGSYGSPTVVLTIPTVISGIAVDAADDVFVAETPSGQVQEFPCTGPGTYGSPVPIGSGLNDPTAVAVDATGNVYVADAGNNAIKEFPFSGGSYATSPVVLGSGFNEPQGLAVDKAGDVLVADTGNGAVKKIPYNQGSFGTPVVLDGTFNLALGVAVDGAGDVIADSITGAMESIPYGQSGYGTPVALSYPLRNPQGLAIDTAGDLFIAESDISAIAEIQNGQNGWAPPVLLSQNQFVYPTSLAVDTNGNLFVVDTYNSEVEEIPFSNGSYGSPVVIGSGLGNPQGVALDRGDNVFVAETGANAVVELVWGQNPNNPSGPGIYSAPITLGSGFSGPIGIWVDASENVFVADTGNSAIKEIPYSQQSGYGQTQTLGSGFLNPEGVTTDQYGDIFVADTGNNAVKEMTSNDTTAPLRLSLGATPFAPFAAPHAVAVDANGRLYVVDDNNIWEFQP